jgi:uncharacterized 2Fe-2S/4Fe-4S cluster protein (DUF4445 family)
VKLAQVNKIYLAGAFGNYINPESALQIGLLPPLSIDQIIPVGNAAGDGAKKLLLSKTMREELEEAVRRVEYVELASFENFAGVFSAATMLKPEMPI